MVDRLTPPGSSSQDAGDLRFGSRFPVSFANPPVLIMTVLPGTLLAVECRSQASGQEWPR